MKLHTVIQIAWLATLATSSASVVYQDFSSTAGLVLNGDASSSGGALSLTGAYSDSSGSAFTASQEPLGAEASFSTYFQFRITDGGGISDGDGSGADGIVFVIQTLSNNVGSLGSGIGYQGITPSIGIEFDTYQNPELGDPDGNHVGVNVNGNPSSTITVSEPIRFNDGQTWNAWIDYQGSTGLLEVRWSLDTDRPATAALSTNLDVEGILGQNTGYVGFTSATGGAWGEHTILNWDYRSEYSPVIPEPASALLLGAGSLLFLRRRR